MYLQSTDNIENGQSYTSETKLMGRDDRVVGMIYSDQNVTIFIEQSADGENWDVSTSYDVTAENGKGFSEEVLGAYLRIRVTNESGDDTTEFRLSAKSSSAGDS